MNDKMRLEKNKRIADVCKATRKRRKSQKCRTFKFKVDKSRLTKDQKEYLFMMFVEAKWIYNYITQNADNIWGLTYKDVVNITHKDKDNNDVPVTITHLGTSLCAQIIDKTLSNIKTLHTLKQKGYNVGKLKFKSEYKSIPLKQYNTTHKLKGNNRIKIQGIKQPIKVFGLEQLSQYENIELTSGEIINTGYGDYYITLTCYCNQKETKYSDYKNSILGIDMGIVDNITCSDGNKYNVYVEETEYLMKLQAKLARQKKGSNNYHKTVLKIRKEYDHINNKRNDIANKIVHQLLNDNAIIVIQDEQIGSWKHTYKRKEDTHSSSDIIHHSVLGRIKEKLQQSERVVTLDRWTPTTQHCFNCGTNTPHKTDERTYRCSNCGLTEDRDIHAAKNMISFYISYVNKTKSDALGTSDTVKPANRKISYRNLCGKQEDATSLVLH